MKRYQFCGYRNYFFLSMFLGTLIDNTSRYISVCTRYYSYYIPHITPNIGFCPVLGVRVKMWYGLLCYLTMTTCVPFPSNKLSQCSEIRSPVTTKSKSSIVPKLCNWTATNLLRSEIKRFSTEWIREVCFTATSNSVMRVTPRYQAIPTAKVKEIPPCSDRSIVA